MHTTSLPPTRTLEDATEDARAVSEYAVRFSVTFYLIGLILAYFEWIFMYVFLMNALFAKLSIQVFQKILQ